MLKYTIKKKPHTNLLIVGNYTHDTIVNDQHDPLEKLGGAAAYACAVAAGLDQYFEVMSKVGPDFQYLHQCLRLPHIIKDTKTTNITLYTSDTPRRLNTYACCDPIYPHDIQYTSTTSIACGIMGEVLPRTIQTLRQTSKMLIGDIQGLIRQQDSHRNVQPIPLEATEYYKIIHCFDFLKVSNEELPFINIEQLRQQTTLLVTHGSNGCTVYERYICYHIPTQSQVERDSTGAGDSFLTGFAVGISHNLSIKAAVQLGHYCGGIAVQSSGIPPIHFFSPLLKTLKVEID